MRNKKAAKRRAWRARRRLRKAEETAGPWYCWKCKKVVWQTCEEANRRVAQVKSGPGIRKPELLNAYPCPNGKGWHVGHNYLLRSEALRIGEMW